MNEWEFSYNGLTFGGATDFPLLNIEGLDPPDSRLDSVVRMASHGSYVFAQFLEERHVIIEGEVVGIPGSDLATKVELLNKAFQPQVVALPLSFLLPGEEQKRVNCVPIRRNMNHDLGYNIGQGRWTIELVAEDPRIYEDSLNSLSTNVAVSAGVDFDIDFDFNFGGGSGGSVLCTNSGFFPSLPIIRFLGPCTTPRAININTGEEIRLNTTIVAGDFIDVNFMDRTILLNGATSRYSSLDSLSRWWSLNTGTTEVKFVATATDSNTLMTVSWRSAWL